MRTGSTGTGQMCDLMGYPKQKEVRELQKVLVDCREEILNYHRHKGMSNGRVESLNRKAKLCQRRAYGLKSSMRCVSDTRTKSNS
jgi:transposase